MPPRRRGWAREEVHRLCATCGEEGETMGRRRGTACAPLAPEKSGAITRSGEGDRVGGGPFASRGQTGALAMETGRDGDK